MRFKRAFLHLSQMTFISSDKLNQKRIKIRAGKAEFLNTISTKSHGSWELQILLAFIVCAINHAVAYGQENAPEAKAENTSNSHQSTNALARETSPYLLMHAHNPVQWYGWGEEALALAKKEQKLIFLSIGYSSCHWCHVMERESFMDDEIAKFLNDHFVCIKVDREERPDVDAIYMQSLRIVNPRTNGGWPLSMFLTPEAKPFFGGTYFPARDGDRGARFGFLSIAKKVHATWSKNSERINKDANYVVGRLQTSLSQNVPENARIDRGWIDQCQQRLARNYDSEFGGFGFDPSNAKRPKFPEPSNLMFLAELIRSQSDDAETLKKMFVETCERMMMGGILDHVGGGFHRYSVDRYWKIPHFEKMLYDNGQLTTVYSEAYQITGREDFRQVVEEMVAFVLSEMRDANGGFYSALDAESEGEEGKFYRWEKSEIETTLTSEEIVLFDQVYGLKRPNFEQKYYVPQLKKTMEENATALNLDSKQLVSRLKKARAKLFDVRAKRPRPLTDKKILASWNGMMIRGLADAGRILQNQSYIDAAEKAADFVLAKMVDKTGRLYRTHTQGQSKLNAYLPDYACMIDGLLALHRATKKQRWLDSAAKLQEIQNQNYWDTNAGGYFYTSNDHESLLARAKRVNDGAVPSGNSVSAANLLTLAKLLDRPEYVEMSRKTALNASELLSQFPAACPRMLIAVGKLAGLDDADSTD